MPFPEIMNSTTGWKSSWDFPPDWTAAILPGNFVNLPSKTQVFAPYRIMEYDDIQVAFVGVATPESITKSTPAYFQDQFGRYRFGFCEDETGEALYSQVQSAVDQARGEGADYVIMVGIWAITGSQRSGAPEA